MDFVRLWILQIAGIIVLGSLCDMILPECRMRKYVKMVVGLVLVFSVLRPIAGSGDKKIEIEIPKDSHSRAVELKKQMDEAEREEIIAVYSKKIENKISESIKKNFGYAVRCRVDVERTDANFGSIKGVEILVDDWERTVDVDGMRKFVSKNFGTSADCITVEKKG